MDSEATTRSQEPLSDLPGVSGVQVRRVRLESPSRFYRDGRLVSVDEVIELLVQLTASLPVLDVTPALFIGDVPVTHYERVGTNQYRFRAFEVSRLQPGARISIGWPFAPAARIPTPFVFDPGALPVA